MNESEEQGGMKRAQQCLPGEGFYSCALEWGEMVLRTEESKDAASLGSRDQVS